MDNQRLKEELKRINNNWRQWLAGDSGDDKNSEKKKYNKKPDAINAR